MKFTFYGYFRAIVVATAIGTTLSAQAQASFEGRIQGTVVDAVSGKPIAKAEVFVLPGTAELSTNQLGYFEAKGLKPGAYNIRIEAVDHRTTLLFDVAVSQHKPAVVRISLTPEKSVVMKEAQVTSDAFIRTTESPLCVKNMGWAEMARMPGATLDITKALQAYPGILPKSSFGYSLSMRGGASSENLYTLDGIEVPTLNHFSIQGASGGPNPLINMDFVQGVDVYTGAFPAARGNALSGIIELHQKEARTDRWGARITAMPTDYGVTVDGPLSKKAGMMLSVRNSLTQHYFKLFNIPILPTYQDAQFRVRIQTGDRSELILTGVGGNDKYRLFTEGRGSDALLYNIGYIPQGEQQVGAVGAVYKKYLDNGHWTYVASADGFINNADKFLGNTSVEADRTLRYRSMERAQRLRVERLWAGRTYEIKAGGGLAFRQVRVNNWNIVPTKYGTDTVSGDAQFGFVNASAFFNASRRFLDGKLSVSPGIRVDAYTYGGTNVRLSPRLAASYKLGTHWTLNASAGQYNQAAPSVVLAYTKMAGLQNGLKPLQNRQIALGTEYRAGSSYRLGAEVFAKQYFDYPFLLGDSVSYANALAAYVAVGNQPANSTSTGQAVGFEFFVQRKFERGYFWMTSYTYSESRFGGPDGELQPSVWDSRHYFSLNVGRTWGKGWQWGLRWRYSSGTPYTPYDTVLSAQRAYWDVAQRGQFDYTRLNAARLAPFSQVDLRLDKTSHFKKWSLNWFVDIANVLENSIPLMPYLTVVRDASGAPVVDPNNTNAYLIQTIQSDTGRRLPTIGVIVDF